MMRNEKIFEQHKVMCCIRMLFSRTVIMADEFGLFSVPSYMN
jgi:hypothetical protein